mgnify:CR=1 FL=1
MHEEGYTYTYRTLEQLNKANPDTEYYFIIGADSLFNFDTWMEPERICQEAVLVVATRDHTPLKELDQQMQLLSQKYNGNFIRLDTMNIDVSSELLRSWHESGQSLRYYVPKPVISYIEKNDIYKGNDSDGKYDFIKIKRNFPNIWTRPDFEHTMGVMYTCAALAMVYDYDLEDAQAAGLLHDSAKCIPNKKKLKLCSQHDIPVSDFEKDHPFLLHAKLGAYVASSKYDIKDEEILTAITYHTTGRPGMSLLEKIVYISDYIEPMRDKAPNLAKVRKIAFEDLDECMYEILKDTLEYLEENPKEIDSTTRDAYVYYKELHDRKMQDAANRQED